MKPILKKIVLVVCVVVGLRPNSACTQPYLYATFSFQDTFSSSSSLTSYQAVERTPGQCAFQIQNNALQVNCSATGGIYFYLKTVKAPPTSQVSVEFDVTHRQWLNTLGAANGPGVGLLLSAFGETTFQNGIKFYAPGPSSTKPLTNNILVSKNGVLTNSVGVLNTMAPPAAISNPGVGVEVGKTYHYVIEFNQKFMSWSYTDLNGTIERSEQANYSPSMIGQYLALGCEAASCDFKNVKVTVRTPLSDADIGLRIRNGTKTESIAADFANAESSQLRIAKKGLIAGIKLVPIADSSATGLQIKIKNQVLAAKRFTPTLKIPAVGATASNTQAPAANGMGWGPLKAIDGDVDNYWSSGNYGPQWVQIDYGQNVIVQQLRLLAQQDPFGVTKHEIWGGASPTTLQKLATYTAWTQSGIWYDVTFPATSLRYLRILTTQSPSWVCWNEIEAYGP